MSDKNNNNKRSLSSGTDDFDGPPFKKSQAATREKHQQEDDDAADEFEGIDFEKLSKAYSLENVKSSKARAWVWASYDRFKIKGVNDDNILPKPVIWHLQVQQSG